MPLWTFKDYVSPTGANDVETWYEALSPKGQARLDSILEHLGASQSWQKPEFKRLSGDRHKGLGEIRFKDGGVQQRLIGMNGLRESEYTFLIGCTEKDRKYDPSSALDTAVERRKLLETGRASTSEH